MRISIRRTKPWPRVPGVYDYRQCLYCGALVYSATGQQIHQAWHDDADRAEPDEWEDPGGYIIGDGPLPASVRGGED